MSRLVRALNPSSLIVFVALFISLFAAQNAAAQCVDMTGCTLVFEDEFDGTEVDLSNWTLLTGDGTDLGQQ